MMFSNNFVTIELTQGETTTNNVELIIRIKRNSEDYTNQKGLIVEVQPHNTSQKEYLTVWYTYDGTIFNSAGVGTNIKPVNSIGGFTSQPLGSTYGNGIVLSKTFSPPHVRGGKIYREGQLRVNVRLRENVPRAESRVVLEGFIVLQTTPIRLPSVRKFRQKFDWVQNKFVMSVETDGNNPHNFYEKELSVGWQPLSEPQSTAMKDYFTVDIPESLWGKRLDSFMRMKLNGEIVSEIKRVFNMPTSGIKAHTMNGRVAIVWIKQGGQMVPVHRAHIKHYGEMITKD